MKTLTLTVIDLSKNKIIVIYTNQNSTFKVIFSPFKRRARRERERERERERKREIFGKN